MAHTTRLSRVLSCVLVGAFIGSVASLQIASVYPSPPPPAYGNYGGYGNYPPPPPISSGGTASAFARFFGPLSAGCSVNYTSGAGPGVTTLGGLTSPNGTEAEVEVCTDSFTGTRIPYAVAGSAPSEGNFQVSSTNTIAASASVWADAAFSYKQLGYNATTEQMSSDIFALMRAKKITSSFGLLKTDLKFIATNVIVSSVLLNVTSNNGTVTCPSATTIEHAIANWVASRSTKFDSTNSDHVNGLLNALMRPPCMFPQQAVTAAAPQIVQMVVGSSMIVDQMYGYHKWPVQDLAFMARLASFLQNVDIHQAAGIQSTMDLLKLAETFPIVPAQICSSLGIDGYSAVDTKVTVRAAGPLSSSAVVYLPFTTVFNKTMPATGSDGVVSVPRATLGLYTVPAGSIDTYLTVNASKPVTTTLPFTVAVGFTPGGKAMVSPIGAVVLAKMLQQMGDGFAPNLVPNSAAYRTAYEEIAGGLPAGDYMIRSFVTGSAQQLAVNTIDSLVPTIPFLAGRFIKKAIKLSNPNRVSQVLFDALVGKGLETYTTKDKVMDIVRSAYFKIKQEIGTSSAQSTAVFQQRRKLQETADELAALEDVFTSIAATISDSNAIVQNVLVQAQASIQAGTVPPQNLFVQLAQVAQVQNTNLASAIDNVAALVDSGDYSGAAASAAAAETQYTGDALRTTVAAAPVNTDAIQQDTTPTTTNDNNGGSGSDKGRTVGLAVGLTVGLTALAAVGIGSAMYVKKRRLAQAQFSTPMTAENC